MRIDQNICSETLNDEINELKEEIRCLPLSASGKRFRISPELRYRLVQAQLKSKLTMQEFVTVVGISSSVLSKWKREHRNDLKSISPNKRKSTYFQRVEVTGSSVPNDRFTVEGPFGLKIPNLDVQHISQLLRQLC